MEEFPERKLEGKSAAVVVLPIDRIVLFGDPVEGLSPILIIRDVQPGVVGPETTLAYGRDSPKSIK